MPTAKGDEIFPDSMEEEFQMVVSEAIAETKVLRALQQIANALGEYEIVETIDNFVFNVCRAGHDFDTHAVYDELPPLTTSQALEYLSRRVAKLEGKQ